MTERHRHPGRKTWSPPRRWAYRSGRLLFNLTLAVFVTKHPDGTLTTSWTAVWAAALLVVLVMRLMPAQTPSGWAFAPVGWPEVWLVVATLYVKPINDALTAYARKNPEGLINALFARMGVGDVAQGGGFNGPANDGAPGGDADG